MIASIKSAARRGHPFGRQFGARRLTFIAAASLAVAACGTDDAPGPLEAGPQGRIRFVNLITDPARNPVNAILEGVPFGVGLAYTQSTPSTLPAPSTANYSPVLTGDRSLVLQRTADPTVTVATLPVTIATGTDYTLFATGGTGGSAVTGFTTTDVNTPVTTGQVRIRVVNMSPAAGAVDVFITAPDANLATATPAATGLANRATFAGVTVAPGNYQVRTVPAGTAPAARAAAVNTSFTTPAAIAAGGSRTIIIADAPAGGAPLRSFALTDQ
jgi:hypothetical protein